MNTRRNCGIILLLPCLAIVGVACSRQPPKVTARQAREVMGTLAEVTAVGADDQTAQMAVAAAFEALDKVNLLMSDYRDDSEIGRLNLLPSGEPLTVSPETFLVLQRSADFSQASGGAFDITCRPLVKLWQEAGRRNRLPDETAIATAVASVGWAGLRLDLSTRQVTKTRAGMQVDLGGIAKGYSLDLAAERMRTAGALAGLVDVGGDIVAMGSQVDGSPWRIGIQHPLHSGLILKLALADRAVATSGNQQRFNVIDGRRYSHIIDPRSGRPAEQVPSVTVIAPDGISADAWATAFSVLSVDEGLKKARDLPGVEVMWAWGHGDSPQIAKTPGFDQYVIP